MEWENMFPDGFHPQAIMRTKDATGTASYFTITQRPVRYIITDFGMSSRYDPNDLSPQKYKDDIYYIGDLIRTEFIQVSLLLLLTLFPHALP